MKFAFLSLFALLAASAEANKNGGHAPVAHDADGMTCKLKYNDNNSRYYKVNGHECPTGYTCEVGENDVGQDGEIDGKCEAEECAGKADPDEDQDLGTIRVTICHRTCSETNPWVRITIDDDAWSGDQASGCGHSLQHDIRDECANKEPWTAWGKNRKDYLIKWHGTRAQVREDNNFEQNSNEEKAYWKYWERACPYVRQDKCCDWESGSCCGDNPNDSEAPSAGPTKSPTATPSKTPTASPTITHSGNPTEVYIPPSYECPSAEPIVKLIGINQEAADDFGSPDLPVIVTSIGGTNDDGRTTVDFSVCPPLIPNDPSQVFTYYGSPDKVCEPSDGSGPCVDYTAVCTQNPDSSYAIVNVFAASSAGQNLLLPVCCGEDQETIEYSFMVLCECPPMSDPHVY